MSAAFWKHSSGGDSPCLVNKRLAVLERIYEDLVGERPHKQGRQHQPFHFATSSLGIRPV